MNDVCAMDPVSKPMKEIFAVLNSLVAYAQTHFDTEERLLQTHGYLNLAQQQREHVAFTTNVFKLAQRLKIRSHIYRQISDFIMNWYISHILRTDREYIEFLLSKGVT